MVFVDAGGAVLRVHGAFLDLAEVNDVSRTAAGMLGQSLYVKLRKYGLLKTDDNQAQDAGPKPQISWRSPSAAPIMMQIIVTGAL